MKKKDICIGKYHIMVCSALFSYIISSVGGFIDSILAGNYFGETAVSAVGLINTVYMLLMFTGVLIGNGTAIHYSRLIGSNQKTEACKVVFESIVFALCLGLFMCVVLVCGEQGILDYFGTTGELREYARGYYTYFKVAAVFYPLYWLIYNLVFADGDANTTALSDTAMLICNLAGSVFFMKRMGIAGISLGTLCGVAASLLVLSFHFLKKSNAIHVKPGFSVKSLWESVRLSLVSASMYLYSTVIGVLLNKFVISHFGENCLPVYSIVSFVLTIMAFAGANDASVAPFISVYQGEENTFGMKKMLNEAIRVAVLLGAGTTVLLFLFASYIPALYGISTEELYAVSVRAVRSAGMLSVCFSINALYSKYMILIGKTAEGMVFSFVCMLAAPLLLVEGLGTAFGFDACWVGYGLAPGVSMLLGLCYMLGRYGRKRFPYMIDDTTNQIIMLNFSNNVENLLEARDQAAAFVHAHKKKEPLYYSRVTALMIEEMGMMLAEVNPGKSLTCEFCVTILNNDRIRISVKDNGIYFDLTHIANSFGQNGRDDESDDDMTVFRAHFIRTVMGHMDTRSYLITTGFNRNYIELAEEL